MFNEMLDIAFIDMLMSLRPTQSSSIFLQQLGNGLKEHKGKVYLNVLDFIGNYEWANLIPFLLSENRYTMINSEIAIPQNNDYTNECVVDFDFRVLNIFKNRN